MRRGKARPARAGLREGAALPRVARPSRLQHNVLCTFCERYQAIPVWCGAAVVLRCPGLGVANQCRATGVPASRGRHLPRSAGVCAKAPRRRAGRRQLQCGAARTEPGPQWLAPRMRSAGRDDAMVGRAAGTKAASTHRPVKTARAPSPAPLWIVPSRRPQRRQVTCRRRLRRQAWHRSGVAGQRVITVVNRPQTFTPGRIAI